MQDSDFQFSLEDLDGVRVIKIVFPPTIQPHLMAENYSRYMGLWESDTPSTVLCDMRQLEQLLADAERAIGVLLRRVGIMPTFVASAWVCGENEAVAEQLRELIREAGRDATSVVATEEEAVAFLLGRIASWRSEQGEA